MGPSRADRAARAKPSTGKVSAVLVAALWLGGCGARGAQGPAWPAAAERETDGGESIAPREARVVTEAEVEVVPDADAVAPSAAAVATPAAAAAITATVTAPTITAPEDSITIEAIVIEISDE